ncbi:unknown [Prevotella sp. CAG:755]|nr:unknown [Prevotella sp. CAG:755]
MEFYVGLSAADFGLGRRFAPLGPVAATVPDGLCHVQLRAVLSVVQSFHR